MEYYIIIFILFIVFAIRKEKILDFSSFLLVSCLYIMCYGIVPLVILWVDVPTSYTGPMGNIAYDPVVHKYRYFHASTLAFISYLFFLFGYRVSTFKKKALFHTYLNSHNVKKLYKITKWIFLIGMAFLILYIMLFGSISNMLLANKRMAYGGEAEVEIDSPFLFLILLAKVIIFCSYMFWGMKKISDGKVKTLFYLSLLLSLFLLFRFSGRMILMTFIAAFVLSSFILKQKLPKLKFVILAALGGLVILFGNAMFKSFLYEDAFSRRQEYYSNADPVLTPFLDIIGGFSFPYRNLLHYYEYSDFSYFIDMVQFPLYILPRRIIPIRPVETTIEVNTMNILGIPGGIMPPDIVTYGLLNLGILGVILIAFAFGILCKYIDSYQRKGAPALSVIVIVALIFIVGFRMMYFNPKQLTSGSFYFFISLAIIRLLKPKIRYILKPTKSFNNES